MFRSKAMLDVAPLFALLVGYIGLSKLSPDVPRRQAIEVHPKSHRRFVKFEDDPPPVLVRLDGSDGSY